MAEHQINRKITQQVRVWQRMLPLCLAGLLFCGIGTATAQDTKKGTPANPVGAGWDSKVKPADGTTASTISAEQSSTIAKVDNYFNALTNLHGRFVQIDPDKAKTKGKFYVQKPGRFRFDYARPSRKIVISDGRFLAIQDLDLRNEDIYELDNTPFRILLRKDVDLLRDARIIAVSETPDQISVTLADKDPDAVGQITVLLSQQPSPALAGWVTADAQGLETRVDVSNLSKPDTLKPDLFIRKKLYEDAIRQ